MNILVTGGTGYIGSHTALELLNRGHTVTIVDNLVNSDITVLDAIEEICGKRPNFVELDVRDTDALTLKMKRNSIEAVIHFAALKAVGESIKKPLLYYRNNIEGLLSVLEAMKQANIQRLIFSSSATVYGDPDSLPITEEFPLKKPTNPYGATKQMAEQIIEDICNAQSLSSVLLRYFNPIGAHSSGLIGELPKGPPNNLIPYVAQAAAGIRGELNVFGKDYDTPDGTGVRDYIHVVDLAKAHVAALSYCVEKMHKGACEAFNVGTGSGTSVLAVIKEFEKINNVTVPYTIAPRRSGDVATCYASVDKAADVLQWKAELSLQEALKDTWRWQQNINS